MGCRCKEKKQIPPAPQPAKIILTENGTVPNPPEPVPPVPAPPPPLVLDPSELVNKLNQILTPQLEMIK
jgi:hypothetical protein